jgi:hypothetical protein
MTRVVGGYSLSFKSAIIVCDNRAHKVLPGGDGMIFNVITNNQKEVVKIQFSDTYCKKYIFTSWLAVLTFQSAVFP